MTLSNASSAKAGAQFHCDWWATTVYADLSRRSWAPAFAGEAFGVERGHR
jgi:hypothetical protein